MKTDLRHYIRCYDDALPADMCQRLVEAFDAMAQFQQRNGLGVRDNLADSAWTELNITQFAEAGFLKFFREQVEDYAARYNSELGLGLPVSPVRRLSELIIKRYRGGSGERFQPHFDALGEVCNRYLVFLWYLNDVADGGQTEFPDLDHRVSPKAGRLLMFPPYWMFQHAGRAPLSGDKYILSTYLLY